MNSVFFIGSAIWGFLAWCKLCDQEMDGLLQGAILAAQRFLTNRNEAGLLIHLENRLDVSFLFYFFGWFIRV